MKRILFLPTLTLLCLTLLGACTSNEKATDEWVDLFNGQNLEGWVPKITGYPTGENYGNTFRVEDGLLTVSYDQYYRFDNRFGHLFYEKPFKNYHLKIEYRFIGEQVEGGALWALKNSGVMLHSQDPYTMLEQQDFPISLEAQFLGGTGDGPRPTGNLCTPGTHVNINGELVVTHCINAAAKTYEGEQWVTIEIISKEGVISHILEDETVIQYYDPVIGGGIVQNFDPAVKLDGQELNSGFIALQSESHPIQFRKVQIKELD